MSFFTYPVGVLSIGLALAAALVSDADLAAGLYVCSLLAILANAGALFLSLFGSFIRGRIDAAG